VGGGAGGPRAGGGGRAAGGVGPRGWAGRGLRRRDLADHEAGAGGVGRKGNRELTRLPRGLARDVDEGAGGLALPARAAALCSEGMVYPACALARAARLTRSACGPGVRHPVYWDRLAAERAG